MSRYTILWMLIKTKEQPQKFFQKVSLKAAIIIKLRVGGSHKRKMEGSRRLSPVQVLCHPPSMRSKPILHLLRAHFNDCTFGAWLATKSISVKRYPRCVDCIANP